MMASIWPKHVVGWPNIYHLLDTLVVLLTVIPYPLVFYIQRGWHLLKFPLFFALCCTKIVIRSSLLFVMYFLYLKLCRFRWPRGLRRRSAAARLLGSRVQLSLRTRLFISCVCCVLSGSGLSFGLITLSEESYGMCVYVKQKPQHWGGLGLIWAAASQKKVVNIIDGKSFWLSSKSEWLLM